MKAFVLQTPGVDQNIRDDASDVYDRACAVLSKMEYSIERINTQDVSDRMTDSLETQYGSKNALLDAYEYVLHDKLSRAKSGDVIIIMEPWHLSMFRGLFEANGGYFKPDIPIVEFWIDYPNSVARHRVFATESHRAWEMGRSEILYDDENWIVSYPYYSLIEDKGADISLCKVEGTEVFSLRFMEASRRGTPVVAPDCGAVGELIEHGKTGVLYRANKAQAISTEWACRLNGTSIRALIVDRFSVDESVKTLKPYFTRITDGRNNRS